MEQTADEHNLLNTYSDAKKSLAKERKEKLNDGNKALSNSGERCIEPQENSHLETEWNHFEHCRHQISLPSRNDILCGRGKSFYNHEGNKLFRDIVGKNIDAYINASRRSKRSEIVRAVVDETLETGAKFLKRMQNRLDWYDGGLKVARQKVGHALRDASSKKIQEGLQTPFLKMRKRRLFNREHVRSMEKVVDITSEISEDQVLLSLLKDCLLESEEIAETPQGQNVLNDNQETNFKSFNTMETNTSLLSWSYLDPDKIGVLAENFDFARVAAHDNNDIKNEDKEANDDKLNE